MFLERWLNPSQPRNSSQGVACSSPSDKRLDHTTLLCLAHVGDRSISLGLLSTQTGKLHSLFARGIPVDSYLDLPPVNGARAWNSEGRVLFFVGATTRGPYLYHFDLETGRLQVSSETLEFLPWTLGYDSRYPKHLWCFAVKPSMGYSPLALFQMETATGKMRLVTAFEGKYIKAVLPGQDNYCGSYDQTTSRFFIFLEKGMNKNKYEEDEEEDGDGDPWSGHRHRSMEQKRRRREPLLLTVDTDRGLVTEVHIQFARLPVKLNTLESCVYSRRWNCLFGFASYTKGKCMFRQRLRMHFVRVDVCSGEITLLGQEWEGYKRAEDGLIALDEERGLLFTSIVRCVSAFIPSLQSNSSLQNINAIFGGWFRSSVSGHGSQRIGASLPLMCRQAT
ncbi:hypothetical protein QOT17_002352 [Balamuthia mandrillaris]